MSYPKSTTIQYTVKSSRDEILNTIVHFSFLFRDRHKMAINMRAKRIFTAVLNS